MHCAVHQNHAAAQLPALRALRCEELRPAAQRSWAPAALSGRKPQRSSKLSCPLCCTRSRASGDGCCGRLLAAAAAPDDCCRDMAAPGSIHRSSEAPEPPRRRCLPGPAPPRAPSSGTCAALGHSLGGTLARCGGWPSAEIKDFNMGRPSRQLVHHIFFPWPAARKNGGSSTRGNRLSGSLAMA